MSDPFVFDHKRLFNEPTMEQHGSHMIIKNVHKPEKTKYLTIDTRFRDQYDTNLLANYTITLPERVNSVKSMKALQLEMPLSYNNISASLGNNSFQLTNINKTYVIALDDGFYPTDETTDGLAPKINTKLSSSTVTGISIALGTDGKIEFTNVSGVDVTITFDNVDCTKIGTTGKSKGGLSARESLMSKLGWILGFRLPSYTIPKSGGKLKGEAIADASGLPYFYLIVDEFKNSNPHSFLGVSRTSQLSSQQILARIAVDTSSFNIGVSGATAGSGTGPQIMTVGHNDNMVSDTRTYGELVDIQKMNVRIVDQFGRIMNFNGLDFSFLLELIHE